MKTVAESNKDVVEKNDGLKLELCDDKNVLTMLNVFLLQVGVNVKRKSPILEQDNLWNKRVYVVILSPHWIAVSIVSMCHQFIFHCLMSHGGSSYSIVSV